jgi:hypothetical protein
MVRVLQSTCFLNELDLVEFQVSYSNTFGNLEAGVKISKGGECSWDKSPPDAQVCPEVPTLRDECRVGWSLRLRGARFFSGRGPPPYNQHPHAPFGYATVVVMAATA